MSGLKFWPTWKLVPLPEYWIDFTPTAPIALATLSRDASWALAARGDSSTRTVASLLRNVRITDLLGD
ncbi:MAG: hypothetical protein DMD87_23180 [Candidatus Rokuibacteriota bacterium]|nr:MAG: hypothetical protein DMD87_23180 [Candidatus Rokubacteria bacterium]